MFDEDDEHDSVGDGTVFDSGDNDAKNGNIILWPGLPLSGFPILTIMRRSCLQKSGVRFNDP